jgi:hypothetical protein
MSKLSRSSVSLSTLMSLNSDDKKFGPPPESIEFLETALLLVQGGMSPTRSYPKTSFHEKAVKLFLKFISHFSRWGCGSCFHPDSVYVGPCFDP